MTTTDDITSTNFEESPPNRPRSKSVSFRSILNAYQEPKSNKSIKTINFEDLRILRRIDKGKCMIFVAKSKHTPKKYALKVFPSKDSKTPSQYYTNELRFNDLKHKNVIEMMGCKSRVDFILDGKKSQASYIVLEYAPYRDLCQAVLDRDIFEGDEKLVRTYFRQTLGALEYLHEKNVFHLDLKLENLLIGDDFQIKVADFDNSYIKNDQPIRSRGTKYYRAPELVTGNCSNPAAADVYSLGVVLFVMKTCGFFPHYEDEKIEGIDFYRLLMNDPKEFWIKQCVIQGKGFKFFSEEFKQLAEAMLAPSCSKRPSLRELWNFEWVQGPVYEEKELVEMMHKKFEEPTVQ
jgi:serine/threonine protein kinase